MLVILYSVDPFDGVDLIFNGGYGNGRIFEYCFHSPGGIAFGLKIFIKCDKFLLFPLKTCGLPLFAKAVAGNIRRIGRNAQKLRRKRNHLIPRQAGVAV